MILYFFILENNIYYENKNVLKNSKIIYLEMQSELLIFL